MVNINLKTLVTCSSTNDLAFQSAQDGLEEGVSFLSYSQTKGRGRNDNKWTSKREFIFIYDNKDQKMKKKLATIIFDCCFSVIEVLLKFGINQNQIELKWPNDILVDNKKLPASFWNPLMIL